MGRWWEMANMKWNLVPPDFFPVYVTKATLELPKYYFAYLLEPYCSWACPQYQHIYSSTSMQHQAL